MCRERGSAGPVRPEHSRVGRDSLPRLGGSEIAAVVGLSPWVSRFALWHRKRGTLGKQEVNAGMNWGHRLEPASARRLAEKREELDVEARHLPAR